MDISIAQFFFRRVHSRTLFLETGCGGYTIHLGEWCGFLGRTGSCNLHAIAAAHELLSGGAPQREGQVKQCRREAREEHSGAEP